jgi:hypothetical protein
MWQYTPRVAVICGLRTPFAKSGTHYAHLSALVIVRIETPIEVITTRAEGF